jgi:hypothetical protein
MSFHFHDLIDHYHRRLTGRGTATDLKSAIEREEIEERNRVLGLNRDYDEYTDFTEMMKAIHKGDDDEAEKLKDELDALEIIKNNEILETRELERIKGEQSNLQGFHNRPEGRKLKELKEREKIITDRLDELKKGLSYHEQYKLSDKPNVYSKKGMIREAKKLKNKEEMEEMKYHNKLIQEETENFKNIDRHMKILEDYKSLTKKYNRMPEGDEKEKMKIELRKMRKIKERAEIENEEFKKKDTDYQYRKFFDGSIYAVIKALKVDEKGIEMEELLDKQPEAREKLFGIGAINSKNIDNPEFTNEFIEYVKKQKPGYLGYFMFDYLGRGSDSKLILGELKTMVDSYEDAKYVYYEYEKEKIKNELMEKLKKAEDKGDEDTIEDLKEKLENNNNMLEYMPLKGSKMFSTGYTKLNYVMGADGKIGYDLKTPDGIKMLKETGMPKVVWILKDGTYEVDLSDPWFYKLKKDKYFLDPEKVRQVDIRKNYGSKSFSEKYTAIPTHYFDNKGKKINLIKKIKK